MTRLADPDAPGEVDVLPPPVAAPLDGEAPGNDAASPHSSRSSVDRATVAGAVALCGVLGLWGLARVPLWMDEAISLGATNQLGRTLRDTAVTMGLYYVLLDGWTALAGTSVAALRLPSLVAAMAAVAMTAVVGRRLVGRRAALVGTLVLAASPGLVRYGQEARAYALVTLLATLLWAAGLRAVEARRTGRDRAAGRWWAVVALVAVLGVLSHGMFALQVVAFAASLLVLPERGRLLRDVAPAVVATVAVVLGLSALGADAIADWVEPLSVAQLGDVARELLAPLPIAAAVLGATAAAGAVVLVRRHPSDPLARWHAVATVVWAVVPLALLVVVSVVRPYLVPRYLLGSLPAVALLVGVAVDAAWSTSTPSAPSGRGRRVGALALAAVVVVALVAGQVALHRRTGDDWAAAARTVATGARPGDAIVFSSAPIRIPFEAAWQDVDPAAVPTAVWADRALGEVRRFDDQTTPEVLEGDLAEVDRLWLVHQTMESTGDEGRDEMLRFPPVRDGFRVAARHRAEGDVQVLLLVRR